MTLRSVFSWLAPKLFSCPVPPRARFAPTLSVAAGSGGAAPSPTQLRKLLGEEHPAYAAAAYVTMTGFVGDWRRDGAISYGLAFTTFDGEQHLLKVSSRDFRRLAHDAAHRLHPIDYGQNGPFQGCHCDTCGGRSEIADTDVDGGAETVRPDSSASRAS